MNKNKYDEEIFKEMVGEVRPLKKTPEKISRRSALGAKNIRPNQSLAEASAFIPLSDFCTETLSAEACVDYLAPGQNLSPSLIKKFRQGNYPKKLILDLHGDTVESARVKCLHFLHKAYQEKKQGLLIIHGKGKNAVLKNHLIHWLKQVPWVLYFCSAIPSEGGAGALYVLIKKNKSENTENTENIEDVENIENIRKNIDELDDKINALLCERFRYAKKAAEIKKTLSPDIKREQKILSRMRDKAMQARIPSERIETIYQTILEEMKKYQT